MLLLTKKTKTQFFKMQDGLCDENIDCINNICDGGFPNLVNYNFF